MVGNKFVGFLLAVAKGKLAGGPLRNLHGPDSSAEIICGGSEKRGEGSSRAWHLKGHVA